ncbi:MAG TPA: hypothetical protein VNS49_18210 [Streptomyces sp.]|nr:hypothetical protein [Streptomyces sp.]
MRLPSRVRLLWVTAPAGAGAREPPVRRDAASAPARTGRTAVRQGGFAVHFFDRALVDALAKGWKPDEVHAFEEGDLPRRLWRVTQSLPT